MDVLNIYTKYLH